MRVVVAAKDPLIARSEALARLPRGVPVHCFHGWELTAELVFEQLASTSLFEPASAYYYEDFLDFKVLKADAGRIEQALEAGREVPLALSQVIEAEWKSQEQRIIKGEAFHRWAKGAELVDACALSDPRSAPRWLRDWAKRETGLDVAAAAAAELLALCAGSVALAGAELRKLALLLPEGATNLERGALEGVVAAQPSAKQSQLAEAIVAGADSAGALLTDYRQQGLEVIPLVYEVSRKLLQLRAINFGEPVYPPFLQKQLEPLAARWRGRRLATAISLTATLEHGLKSGRYAGENTQDAAHRALGVFARDMQAALRLPA